MPAKSRALDATLTLDGMANPEHLAKLKEGVAAWNRWRKENPELIPDLQEANLTETNLSGADLSEASLRGTDFGGAKLLNASLSGADLRGARLTRADLRGATLGAASISGANLTGTCLAGADLNGADFVGSDLSGADLGAVYLGWANFTHANLDGASLAGATFRNTSFGFTLLKGAIGLDSCRHDDLSYLDYFTLRDSWPLPLAFLRGCGLPDEYITYLPALLNQPIQFYSCFISHSTKDKPFAERIYSDLQNKNVRCWYAPEDLKIGDRFQEKIEDSIRLHDKLLIVLSEASVNSAWVEREVQAAREREDRTGKPVLFPIRLDDAVMNANKAWTADLRRTRHIGDFANWMNHDSYQQAFDRLLRDLKAQAAASASP